VYTPKTIAAIKAALFISSPSLVDELAGYLTDGSTIA